MFFGNGKAQLGRAISTIVDLAVEINFTSNAIRVISCSDELSALHRIKTYSDLIRILREKFVFGEDVELFDARCCMESVVTQFLDGEQLLECELRMNTGKSNLPKWYSALFLRTDPTNSFDGQAVLIINNIDHHKAVEARAAELSEQVERDSLTGLYNKKAGRTLIDSYLSGEGKSGRHMLFFCDLDDFKSFNDSLGHPFGDALLSNISEKFCSIFRREDIICRIGGDEFIVLMKNVPGLSYAARRADLLLGRMKQAFSLGDNTVSVTMSIGIACYPENGTTYAELLESADKAMYASKSSGKNQYSFCDGTFEDSRFSDTKENLSGEHRPTSRNHNKISDYIFNCLYESTDLNKTLPLVLQLMGTHFSLGRVTIADLTEDTMLVTQQWNAAGIKPITRSISYTGELRALFESSRSGENMSLRYNSFEDAPLDVREKLIAAGFDDVRAFIHCPLLDKGIVRGYIAFFDCRSNRVWSNEERDTLSYAARLISLFVFRQQAHVAMERSFNITRQLLDGSSVALSFIDPDSCEMLCLSRKAMQDIPHIETGSVCPYAPYGSSKSCQKCPLMLWKSNGASEPCSIESYDNRTKEWLLLTATEFTLDDGRKVCLCGRMNIDAHKQRQTELEEENARLRKQLEQLSGNSEQHKE